MRLNPAVEGRIDGGRVQRILRASVSRWCKVWEVVRTFVGIKAQGDQALKHAAKLTGLTPEQLRLALRYYADFQDEIDDWIRRVDEEAARAEAAWRREQEILRLITPSR
ncbi:MAG: hypothetical protein HYX94_13195 [Chloroflexi bacterium]|nr:hypothetical protein [Chloroflexota bacterium]